MRMKRNAPLRVPSPGKNRGIFLCGYDGIGRRAGFRFLWSNPCGFDPHYPYHVAAECVLRPYFYAVNRRCWMRGRKVKIHIIGGSGSGKSFLAEELSKEYGIPHYDLDDLQWDQQAAEYGTKRDPQERQRLLEHILKQPDWIVEGVYYAWCQQCFADADRIYLLCVPRYQYRYRIIRRFVRRKLGIEKGKKETLKSVVNLLKWCWRPAETAILGATEIANLSSDKITKQPRLAIFISLWLSAQQQAPSRSAKKLSPASSPGSFLHAA